MPVAFRWSLPVYIITIKTVKQRLYSASCAPCTGHSQTALVFTETGEGENDRRKEGKGWEKNRSGERERRRPEKTKREAETQGGNGRRKMLPKKKQEQERKGRKSNPKEERSHLHLSGPKGPCSLFTVVVLHETRVRSKWMMLLGRDVCMPGLLLRLGSCPTLCRCLIIIAKTPLWGP